MKEKHCVDCHFLVEDVEMVGMPTTDTVGKEHRKLLREGLFAVIESKNWKLRCYQEAWAQEYGSRKFEQNDELNLIDRSNSCFFWKSNEKVPLEAAKRLEERQHKNFQFLQEWKHVKIGLWIAVVVIVFSLIFNVLSFVFK